MSIMLLLGVSLLLSVVVICVAYCGLCITAFVVIVIVGFISFHVVILPSHFVIFMFMLLVLLGLVI